MNTHPGMVKFVTWLLNHSLQAGVLVILVLSVQWIFRGRLTSRWRFALWWVVLVRLLLPVGPQSAVSLFNYFQPALSVTANYHTTQSISQPPANIQIVDAGRLNDSPERNNQSQPAPVPLTQPAVSHSPAARQPSPAAHAPVPMHPRNYRDLILPAAVTIWLGGMAILVLYVLIQILRFQWRLSRSTVPAEPASVELLQNCQREFGVSRRIDLMETDAVKSPALFGLFRLRLLLPQGFTKKFSRNELRYVFLHELAHVKRGDLWLNWLITALQIAHWFNPLIWLGFARLRSDRELACDELALMHAGEKTGTCYGETVVKLLEGLSHPAAIPGLVGILEDKKQMRRRILMIANFKKPGRWSALAVLLVAAIAAATLTDAQTENLPAPAAQNAAAPGKSDTGVTASGNNATLNPAEEDSGTDLLGNVHAKDGGPLAATVFISTAGPKTGGSTLCPSCYADCSKSATADSDGAFDIKSLNPQLTFRILAAAKGYKPKYVSDVDPAKGPVNIELEPVTAADATPDRSLRGRVVDKNGKPIEGATVEMIGIQSKDGNGRWGALKGIDPMAVTDANGEFSITAQNPFDMMDVRVEARGLAPKAFSKLSSSAHHDLVLAEGASLTGRVLLDGKPLKGVSVGISAVDRSAGRYLGHFEVGTEANGAFTFVNLPPDADFYVYTRMSTMKEYGAVPMQKFHTGADGETIQLGDLIARPAYRLQGRVVLADGQPVPPKTRLSVSHADSADGMQLILDENGGFDTTGIPAGTINLGVRVNGYHISAQNKSLDRLNLTFLSGRVDHDIIGMVYLLEKGPTARPDFGGGISEADMPQNRPLRGAEGGIDHSRDWPISGKVIDSESKEPLASFHVTPGETDNFGRTRWDPVQLVEATNGSYLVYVNKRIAQPLLKIEADGYLPGSISLVPQDANNADLVLTKGTGPSGTVVDSEGHPAAGATLVLLCDGANEVGFDSRGEFTAYWNKNLTTTADAAGHFKFQPQLGMKKLGASSSNGFAVISLEAFAAYPEIRLQPFGKISGTLKRTSGPGTNEDLDLSFSDSARQLRINLNNHAITDSQGHFTFDGVPAGLLELSYRVPTGDHNSWQNEPLQQVEVKPGQTLDLQVNTSDRVPPPTEATYQQPRPKRIPGSELKGFVLLPSGAPAADVDVALDVEGTYLALGKATLSGNSLRENGLMVTSGADGSFTLPMFEGAKSVVALNEQGFAMASIDAFKASPQLTLQQWGRVEGTLQINHHPASNETIVLGPPQRPIRISQKNGTNETTAANAEADHPWVMYQYSAFQAKTDEHGHFAISFVPPGENTVSRVVPLNDEHNSSVYRPLGNVNVKTGETTASDFSSEGITVTGRLKFSGTNSMDLENCMVSLTAPMAKMWSKLQSAKTPEERKAILDSPEYEATAKNSFRTSIPVITRPDGFFHAEEVPPGTYEISLRPGFFVRPSQTPTNFVMYASAQNVIVPPPSDQNDTAPFDAGTVEVQSYSIPTFSSAAQKH